MTQLYFKFINHVNINGVPTFWGLNSNLNAYQKDKQGSYIINGLWYDLNEYYKKASGHDINDNEWTSHLQWLYMFSKTSSNYTLPLAYLSVYDTKKQADNYDVNNAHYSLYKILDNTYNEQPNYGRTVNVTNSTNGYDLKLGDNKTYYLRIDIGNPTDPVYNYPFIDYQHQPFNCHKDNSKPHIYDEINDTTCTVPNSITSIIYNGKSTTDVSFDINLSGKTSVMKFNTNNTSYNTNSLNYNDYFIISPHDSSTPVTPPEPVQTYAEINSTLDGASLNLSRLPVDKSSTLTITADEQHVLDVYSANQNFADAFYKIGENGQPQYRFSFDDKTHKSASCSITPSDTSVITVSCVTKWSNQPETQRKQVPIILTLTHCTSNTTSLPENTQEEFENGHVIEKTITLTADEGYIFDKDVIYYNYDLNGGNYFKDTAKATNKNTISFTMHAGAYDNLKYQAVKPEIIAVASLESEPVSTGLDSIHIYHMRNAELDNLSNKIITYLKQQGDTSELKSYDYTRFIGQVYRLPFDIPIDIEENVNKVSVGLYNLNMITKKVTKEFYDINIGSIVVPSDDSTSYNALKVTLYLPFINSVDLSINDVIDNTLKITYRINLLNGVNTLIIKNNNGILVNQNVNVSTSLQIFGNYYDKDVNHLNSVLNNNLRQAYLVISKKEPIKNLLTYPTNEHGTIKNYNGLTKFANTQLHLDVTFQEKQEILAQLQQGVNIK